VVVVVVAVAAVEPVLESAVDAAASVLAAESVLESLAVCAARRAEDEYAPDPEDAEEDEDGVDAGVDAGDPLAEDGDAEVAGAGVDGGIGGGGAAELLTVTGALATAWASAFAAAEPGRLREEPALCVGGTVE
jgi:hypothetical protein